MSVIPRSHSELAARSAAEDYARFPDHLTLLHERKGILGPVRWELSADVWLQLALLAKLE